MSCRRRNDPRSLSKIAFYGERRKSPRERVGNTSRVAEGKEVVSLVMDYFPVKDKHWAFGQNTSRGRYGICPRRETERWMSSLLKKAATHRKRPPPDAPKSATQLWTKLTRRRSLNRIERRICLRQTPSDFRVAASSSLELSAQPGGVFGVRRPPSHGRGAGLREVCPATWQ